MCWCLQVCLWCWHQIKNEYNALCPACRAPYSELSKQKSPLDREECVVSCVGNLPAANDANKKTHAALCRLSPCPV
jgi:hypothetical protein